MRPRAEARGNRPPRARRAPFDASFNEASRRSARKRLAARRAHLAAVPSMRPRAEARGNSLSLSLSLRYLQ